MLSPPDPVCLLFVAVTLREDSAKKLERRARRVSRCLSDYSLASDSGVFEPSTKRLEGGLAISSLRDLPTVLLGRPEGPVPRHLWTETWREPSGRTFSAFPTLEVGP